MDRKDYNFQININVDTRAFKLIKDKLDKYQKEFADIDKLNIGDRIIIPAGFHYDDYVYIEEIDYKKGIIKGKSSITNTIIEYNLIKKVDGSYLLDFKLKEANENANLKLGVHYDLLYKSSVLASYNQKHLLKKKRFVFFRHDFRR